MKNLFTYPIHPETNYIDPDYVGDANSGMTKRINELLDGSYKGWLGLDPVSDLSATTPDTEEQISKYVNYFDKHSAVSNLAVYDFWAQPLINCTMKLIDSVNIIEAVYNATPRETIITTVIPHEFTSGQLLTLAGFNDLLADYNGQGFYVKVLTTTTLQLAYDIALTNLLIVGDNVTGTFSTTWNTKSTFPYEGNTFNPDDFTIDMNTFVPDPGNDIIATVPDATPVIINSVELNGSSIVSNTYYTKDVGGLNYELYTDSGLTDRVIGSELTNNTVRQVDGLIGISYKIGPDQPYPNQHSNFTLNPEYLEFKVDDIDDINFQTNPSLRWHQLPLDQQQQTFTGFPNQLAITPYVNKEYNELLDPTTVIPEYGPGWLIDTAGYPSYYEFNNYSGIGYNATTGVVRVAFRSDEYDVDPVNTANLDFQWEALTTTEWVIPGIYETTGDYGYTSPYRWHSMRIFDGFRFTDIERLASYNQPRVGTVTNQPGMPVLDPKPCTISFSDELYHVTQSRTVNPNGWGGQDPYEVISWPVSNCLGQTAEFFPDGGDDTYQARFDARPIIDQNIPRTTFAFDFDYYNKRNGSIVIWKPGVNIDDYRMSFNEYGLLNIMEKDGSDQWTVPIYANLKATDPITDFQSTICNWQVSSTTAPCFIAYIGYESRDYEDTNQDAYHYAIWPDVTNKVVRNFAGAGPYDHQPIATFLNLVAFQTMWPDLNITRTSVLDVKVSLCPYDTGTPATGEVNGVYWDGEVAQKTFVNNPELGPPGYELLFPNYWYEDSPGIELSPELRSDPNFLDRGTKPTMFYMSNRSSMNIQTTGDVNAEFLFDGLPVADEGQLAIDSGTALKYEIDTLSIKLPGNEVYSYQDTNNATQYGATIDPTRYWRSGQTTSRPYTAALETMPMVTVTVDANGRLANAVLANTETSEGLFATSEDILLPITALPSTYNPGGMTPAELADVWDTDDEWTTTGEDDRKVWPTVVTPMSASITLNTPSTVNRSQNGLKYTRASGFTKWTLEVEYPPMRARTVP